MRAAGLKRGEAAGPARGETTLEPTVELLFGLLLGFSLTIPPGPMNALIASTATRSYRSGVLTGLGAMSSDALWAAVVFLLRTVVDLSGVVRGVYVVGAGVMAFLSYRILRTQDDSPGAAPTRSTTTYGTALLVGLSNPFQVIWWLTGGLGFAYYGGPVLFLGLFAAIAVWVLVFPAAVHLGTRRSEERQRWVRVGSGVLILGFAAYFLYLGLVP